jgi:agmatine deiminase
MNRRDPSPGTPAALGYRMPAEWEPHAGTWLSWPHKADTWPGKLASIPPIWVEMVRALSPGERVHILVNESAPASRVTALLKQGGIEMASVTLHEIPTDDAWARDHGPIFVTRPGPEARLAVVKWRFNSWGGKYPPWEQDDRVSEQVAARLDVPLFSPGIVLEGGSIDVNGRGTLLTTESCLLNPNRNPQLGRGAIETLLCDYLGVRHILWLREGVEGDDTDGHVDDLTRFVDETTVVTVVEEDPADTNYEPLQENYRRLLEMTDQDGRPLQVVKMPMPSPLYCEDTRLPASYANFYIGNRVVLMPTFDERNDAVAREVLESVFPGRRIVGINAVDLVWGLGAFHCVTQQQPAA